MDYSVSLKLLQTMTTWHPIYHKRSKIKC